MCTFDGSLAMEPFSLMFQQKILPNTTSDNTCSYLLDVETNQKEKTLYPKLKLPQQLHFVSIKNESGS
jgi:hypothetical protein